MHWQLALEPTRVVAATSAPFPAHALLEDLLASNLWLYVHLAQKKKTKTETKTQKQPAAKFTT